MYNQIKKVAVNQDLQYLLPESSVAIFFKSEESIGKGKILDIQNNEYIIQLELYSEIDLNDKDIMMSIGVTSTNVNNIRKNLSTHFCLRITSRD